MVTKKSALLVILFFYVCCTYSLFAEDKHIVVIIPSYNNKNYYMKNLNSVLEQEYSNYTVIYIDDYSSDGTGDFVDDFITRHNLSDKFFLIKNSIRCRASRNIYHAIHTYCADDDIVVILDGDDWFSQKQALTLINNAYQDPDVWLTYGSHRMINGKGGRNPAIPEQVIYENSYRKISWRISHPRTYYAWLYKLIKLEDLQYQGEFIPMAQDFAKMYPMLEMSGGRFKYIQEVLYTYNTNTYLHHFKINKGKPQSALGAMIQQHKKPYTPLFEPLKKSTLLSTSFSCLLILFSHANNAVCIKKLEKFLSCNPEVSGVYVYTPACTLEKVYIDAIPVEFFDFQKNNNACCKSLFQNYDIFQEYCLLVTDEVFLKKSLNIASSVRLLRQTEGFIFSYAEYVEDKKQILKNTTLLSDGIFVFQMGWKPILFYPYKEYAHILSTQELKEFCLSEHQLFATHLTIRSQNFAYSQRSGLLAVPDGMYTLNEIH